MRFIQSFFILQFRDDHVDYDNELYYGLKDPLDSSTILNVTWAIPVACELTSIFN